MRVPVEGDTASSAIDINPMLTIERSGQRHAPNFNAADLDCGDGGFAPGIEFVQKEANALG